MTQSRNRRMCYKYIYCVVCQFGWVYAFSFIVCFMHWCTFKCSYRIADVWAGDYAASISRSQLKYWFDRIWLFVKHFCPLFFGFLFICCCHMQIMQISSLKSIRYIIFYLVVVWECGNKTDKLYLVKTIAVCSFSVIMFISCCSLSLSNIISFVLFAVAVVVVFSLLLVVAVYSVSILYVLCWVDGSHFAIKFASSDWNARYVLVFLFVLTIFT